MSSPAEAGSFATQCNKQSQVISSPTGATVGNANKLHLLPGEDSDCILHALNFRNRAEGLSIKPAWSTNSLLPMPGGIALILGLWARIAALCLIPDLLDAIAPVHIHVGFFRTNGGGGWEYAGFPVNRPARPRP